MSPNLTAHAAAPAERAADALDDVRAQVYDLFDGVRAELGAVPEAPAAPPPPPGPSLPPPPPPPPPPADSGAPAPGDPITAFAPPPTMDWGPERPSLFRRHRHTRTV